MKEELRETITEFFEDELGKDVYRVARSGFGIDFDLSEDAKTLLKVDLSLLDRQADAKGLELRDFLIADPDSESSVGLLDVVSDKLESLAESIIGRLGDDGKGLLVDYSA